MHYLGQKAYLTEMYLPKVGCDVNARFIGFVMLQYGESFWHLRSEGSNQGIRKILLGKTTSAQKQYLDNLLLSPVYI